MHGKWSLRASDTGELIFDNVRVPKANILPGRDGLGAPLSCLDSARYGIAWGAIGAALDCYDTALRYSKERTQFDRPIGQFQLQQKKLAEMITEITKAQLLTFRLGQLRDEGKATSAQISMAKRNNVDMALTVARDARQMLGGMGITGEYSDHAPHDEPRVCSDVRGNARHPFAHHGLGRDRLERLRLIRDYVSLKGSASPRTGNFAR